MADRSRKSIQLRLKRLETHLEQENPVLLQIVKSFRLLDRVGYGLGVLSPTESFATQVPWWPLISVLGTYSSGKSTFINDYLGHSLQLTGNQAVDDKFTVICFSSDGTSRALPGLALDADPRFPFYQISQDIEEVAEGEGRRVDAYLQLKTAPSETLRGKIVIDSPGFDADEQRTSTLRITDHIIDLSDLVLVFFDARHPEPGTMQDALQHLVSDTINRADSNKFLYILNQIDATAREDNPEEVFAAWQRALAQKGLTAGRFYRIYNPEAAIPIENEKLRTRFEAKREVDIAEIHGRMHQVEVERAYRIIGVLEKTAKSMETEIVPRIRAAKEVWKRRVLWLDAIVFGLIALALVAGSIRAGYWEGLRFSPPWWERLTGDWMLLTIAMVGAVALVGYLHYGLRRIAAQTVVSKLKRDTTLGELKAMVIPAFLKNTRAMYSSLATKPVGWSGRARKLINRVLRDADNYVQTLNDQFTDPSGDATNKGKIMLARAVGNAPAPAPSVSGHNEAQEETTGKKTETAVAGS